MRRFLSTLGLLCLLHASAGCAKFASLGRTNDAYAHKVSYPGETLGIISAWYTGSASNWPKIAKVNSQIRPNSLRLGQMVYIPQRMLKRRTALPRSKVIRKAAPVTAVARARKPEPESELVSVMLSKPDPQPEAFEPEAPRADGRASGASASKKHQSMDEKKNELLLQLLNGN